MLFAEVSPDFTSGVVITIGFAIAGALVVRILANWAAVAELRHEANRQERYINDLIVKVRKLEEGK